MLIFDRFESEVRSYCRSFPVVFSRASGAYLFDERGRRYIDFLSGAGSLNYGHNHPRLKRAIVDYLEQDGITHSLDLATTAKARFIEAFRSIILQPRSLEYKFQFTGPTGTNGVEAALKLARKFTGRRNVVAFTGAYHGLSSGALAVTANSYYRDNSFVTRSDVSFLPYDGYLNGADSMQMLCKVLTDPASGVDHPAAVIVETIQGEGGINVASTAWLRALESICRERNILLIVDDIQAGAGRTGTYFSFEDAGIVPDIVVLSKSISGFGLPMTMLLLKPEIDVWKQAEHTGTFRGNNLGFVAAAEALEFWKTEDFANDIRTKSARVESRLNEIADRWLPSASVKGRGLMYGLEVNDPELARAIRAAAFEGGLIVELCGARDTVVKLLPPLNIENDALDEGLLMLEKAAEQCARQSV